MIPRASDFRADGPEEGARGFSFSSRSGGIVWRLRRICLAAAVLAAGCGSPQPAPTRGIVLLDIDTLRADHLGCYGYGRGTSPAIDALAARAVVFDWAFAQAPYTPPSQSSLLTGLHVASHGVRTRADRLRPGIDTVAELLAEKGFATAAFTDGGFMSKGFGLDQGFALFDSAGGGLDRIGPKAIAWLEARRNEPFLLLLHTYDVHTPYLPPAALRDRFGALVEAPTPGFEPSSEALEAIRTSRWTATPLPLPERDLRYAEAMYDAEIAHVDAWIGKILATLAATGLDAHTTVILFSDHGEEFGEHGSVLHEKPYATVTRIPFIVRAPGAPTGQRRHEVIQGVDLLPTVVALTGARLPRGVEGRSLLPALRGEALAPRPAFGENPWVTPGSYMVDRDFHLLFHPGTEAMELFRFRDDPQERVNLAAAQPEIVAGMRRNLDRHDAALASLAARPDPSVIDDETARRLRALGYL